MTDKNPRLFNMLYPEHAKIEAFNATKTSNYRLLFEFLEFLKSDLGFTMAESKYSDDDRMYFDHVLQDDVIINKFIDVDTNIIEQERRAMLEDVRKLQEKAGQ